ncbi:MAG: TetR/AcrR family transcriptional regulator [Sandaracinaceae bacterium]|nr:TetR/AcrR family transcriptional regulator [Sandaracinaceae bacterium]
MRTQILDVATRRFAAQGYGGTSLSAIADEVGIRKASLLYHFPSKDELHRSVLDQVLSRWNEVLPRLLAAGSADRFDALLHETVRFFSEDPDRARLILRETLDNPVTMRERLLVAVAPWLQVIAGYVRRGQESGEVRADADPEAYLLHVIHLVVGGLAISDTLGIVLSPDGASSDIQRLTRELERIAKVSLFTDEGIERMNGRRAAAHAGSH